MKTLLLLSTFIGHFYVTSYRSVRSQTDESPFYTANGDHVCRDGVAISQDMLKKNGGQFELGEWVYIEGVGLKRINDVMNPRHTQRFDVWVKTYEEEHLFEQKHKRQKLAVFTVSFQVKTNVRKSLLETLKQTRTN